jgi:hypothetical protein
MARAAASALAWADATAGATVVVVLAVVVGLVVVVVLAVVVGLAVVVVAAVVVAAVVVLAAVVALVPALCAGVELAVCADAETVGRPRANAARAAMPNPRRVVPLRFFPRCRCPCLTVVMPNLLLVPTAPCTRTSRAPGIRTKPERRRQEGFGSDVADRQEPVALRSLW